MAKKIYIDNRVTTSGKRSQIDQDNSFDLNNHVKTIIAETPAIIQANEWTETTVTLTNAQIDTCGVTPVTILPAPGVGKAYEYEITCACPSGKVNIAMDNSLAIKGETSFTGHFFYLGLIGSKSYHKWTSASTPIYVVDAWFVAGSGYAENEALEFTTATGANPLGSALASDVVFNIKYKVIDL
jgi:hypothetical protein